MTIKHPARRAFARGIIAALLLLGTTTTGSTEENNTMTQANGVNNLHWLVGSWRGEGLGGTFEETWSPPSAGSMECTFKLLHDGKISMYEFCRIVDTEAGPALQLKHFNPDMIGWEEKDKFVTFEFVEMADNEVRFDGVVYRLTAPDSMTIEVKMKRKSGEIETELLECVRVSD